ncbi:MAG: hypothetical protein H6709_24320 [Kofleriaceae bacterium]|nr:hypothetical protein [Kofleriaceae bacterium]
MIGPWRRARELRALVDEVAAVDWRDPAWWALIGGTAAVEGLAARDRAAAAYLVSDGQPAADTFMGWPAPAPATLADAIAEAIVTARAARDAVGELDGTLPDQPLSRALRGAASGATRLIAAAPDRVVFVVGGRRVATALSGEPDDDLWLARALARAAGGDGGVDATAPRGGDDGPPAAIAAVVGDHDPAWARHLHRRAWFAGGGPWLGLGCAGALALASTCHLVIDGYGHALIAARLAAATTAPAALARRHRLAAAAAAVVGDAPVPPLPPLPPTATAPPLGVAWRRLDALPRFAVLGHALGRTLWDDAGVADAPMSPVFQVPVAPGDRDDPLRWRRRVVHALLSVRFHDGRAEPVTTFAARARDAIAREAARDGLASRLLAAAAAVPIPLAVKRRGVGARARVDRRAGRRPRRAQRAVGAAPAARRRPAAAAAGGGLGARPGAAARRRPRHQRDHRDRRRRRRRDRHPGRRRDRRRRRRRDAPARSLARPPAPARLTARAAAPRRARPRDRARNRGADPAPWSDACVTSSSSGVCSPAARAPSPSRGRRSRSRRSP